MSSGRKDMKFSEPRIRTFSPSFSGFSGGDGPGKKANVPFAIHRKLGVAFGPDHRP